MNVFKFHEAVVDSINVEATDDGAEIRFDGNTLGFNPASDHRGYSITNDWNDRHFTIGFDEESILYHLTREDIGDRKSGSGNMSRSEFVAEMYGYVRSVAHPVPESNLDFELVGEIDMDATKEYMRNEGVVDYSDSGLTVNNSKQNDLIDKMVDNPAKLGDLFSNILEPVQFDEMRDCGELIFVRPSHTGVSILILYPNNYIGVVSAQNLLERLISGGGSQLIDHALRSVSSD